MDNTPPIFIGLEGLIRDSHLRVITLQNRAATQKIFATLPACLKRLQVAITLLSIVYRKLSRFELVAGSDISLSLCHDSLSQVLTMIEAMLQEGNNPMWEVGISALTEKLPQEVNNFTSSVELLRSIYQEAQFEFIFESFKELTNMKREYSLHLQQCAQQQHCHETVAQDTPSEQDTVYDTRSDTDSSSHDTSITEYEQISEVILSTPIKSAEAPDETNPSNNIDDSSDEREVANTECETVELESRSGSECESSTSEPPPKQKSPYAITILGQHDSYPIPNLVPGRASVERGCTSNWISSAMLRRANVENRITNVANDPQSVEVALFEGKELKSRGVIELTWSLARRGRSSRTKTGKFSVCDTLPFDVIIGKRSVEKV